MERKKTHRVSHRDGTRVLGVEMKMFQLFIWGYFASLHFFFESYNIGIKASLSTDLNYSIYIKSFSRHLCPKGLLNCVCVRVCVCV